MGQEHKEYTWNLIAKKLAGEASLEELKELERLLRNNPELHYPMQTVTDLWNPSSPTDQQEVEKAFNRHMDRMQELNLDLDSGSETAIDPYPFTTNNKRSRRKALLLASALCLGLGLIVVIRLYPVSRSTPAIAASPAAGTSAMLNGMSGGEIRTGNGSRTHLLLPDSTHVWLNAGSQIRYDKMHGAKRREVYLTGEAFFDVARNAEKPFIIHTARIDIRVLGTSFNVKSYLTDKTTETTLVQGSIEVSVKNRSSEKIILKPNEKLLVTDRDSISRGTGRLGRREEKEQPVVAISKPTYELHTGKIIETSWVDNKLIFQDEAFKDLARQMERWYGVSIRFDNPRQGESRFTGSFENETIQQALEALALTANSNFKYSIHGNQITVYDR
jgi:transmembrane sensor